jgi:hypothetical protein
LPHRNQGPECDICHKHHFPVTNIKDATPEYVRTHIRQWESRHLEGQRKQSEKVMAEIRELCPLPFDVPKAESDIKNGLLYTVVESEDESKWVFRCDSCRQTQDMLDESVTRDTPFPHLPNCPMLKK